MSAARVIELRQYTLHAGERATLLEVFETELIEPQEAVGMRVGGTFYDRDDPDRFVWFRGFTDMAARRQGLELFYLGPVWAAYRDTANQTMIDSDNVLLLRPTNPAHPLPEPARGRAPAGATEPSEEWVAVTTYAHESDDSYSRWLATDVHRGLEETLERAVATWRTEPSENTFPRLPVRTDNVFVWTAAFPHEDAYRAGQDRLRRSSAWSGVIESRLATRLASRQHLRLQPTPRSQHQTSRS